MRFEKLLMRPFGTFSDFELTFEASTGLHLIFGTNGAGKSTTLDALRSVLYGIDSRARNVIPPAQRRVGARLRRSGGETIEFMRRSAKKLPLWDLEEAGPLPLESLAPFLGNLDGTRFNTLFGLDYETMVAGGRDLLEGKGAIGQALFGAMLGGRRLREVTDRLTNEAKALYANGSSKCKIAELAREHKELSKELSQASLAPTAHDRDRRELKVLGATIQSSQEARRSARERAEELGHLRGALRALEQLALKREERRSLGEFAPLDESRGRRVLELAKERESLAQRAEERGRELHQLREQEVAVRGSVQLPVLEAAAKIEALGQRRAAFRSATDEIVDLRRELEEAKGRRGEALRLAGDESMGDSAGTDATLEELSDAADRHTSRLTDLESRRSVVLEDLGRVEPRVLVASAALARTGEILSERLATDLAALAPFSGSVEELRSLELPQVSEVERQLREERQLATDGASIRREMESATTSLAELREAIERLLAASTGPPPTREELRAARARRDEAIDRLAAGGAREALDAQRAVTHADQLADRRADLSALSAEREAHEASVQGLQRRVAELNAGVDEIEARSASERGKWASLWQRAGVGPMDPAAALAWMSARQEVLERAQSIADSLRGELAKAQAEEAEQRGRLKVADEEFSAAHGAWTEWAKRHRLAPDAGPAAAQKRLRMLSNVNAGDREVARLDREEQQRASSAREFQDDVARLADALGVRPSEEVLETALDAANAERSAGFAQTEARMDALVAALKRSTRAAAELDLLTQRMASETAAAKLSTQRIAEIEVSLETLRQEHGVESAALLIHAAERSDRGRSLDADIRALEQDIAAVEPDEGKLQDRLAGRTPEDLADEQAAAQETVDREDVKIAESNRLEGELRARVEATGSADGATIRSRMAEKESEMAEATAAYLRAHLAEQLLRVEVERNRLETQGPMLARAQELFQILTLGAYEKLHPSEDASGKEIMVARRPDGREVGVGDMSSGTCDQLYLALRIASVEHMLETIEPMPFIADDLFVNFDDQRTEAALRVLAELSKSTQVIVFSHHESVVDTAMRLTREGVTVDVLRLQDERTRETETAEGGATGVA